MRTATSRLTRKYQATIPKPVRDLLNLNSGDQVAFEIRGSTIKLRKALAVERAWHAALESTLSEWSSDEDDKAFADL